MCRGHASGIPSSLDMGKEAWNHCEHGHEVAWEGVRAVVQSLAR